MSKIKSSIVWGTVCSCGTENFILQTKFHPWIEKDFSFKMQCSKCNNMLEINHKAASNYYNNRIYSKFSDVSGTVIDLGCGDGFITEYLAKKDCIKNIYALDNDLSCKDSINKIFKDNSKVCFSNLGAGEIKPTFKNKSIDYLVSRDVFMFIHKTDKFFDDITAVISKGLRQIAWYVKDNERMMNNLTPEQIKSELEFRGWEVNLEYLDWYKCGYFISANRGAIE